MSTTTETILTQHLVLKVHTQSSDLVEALIAMVAELGFDTFEEGENEFTTSVTLGVVSEQEVQDLLAPFQEQGLLTYTLEQVAGQNWNATWEASVQPIWVHDRCRIRAAFHEPDTNAEFDLVITPKMAFGTGHHGTTAQVMRFMLAHDLTGTRVLDCGSGTGVLAILAEKLGAAYSYAYDNDPWAVESIAENVAGNGCTKIEWGLGEVATAAIPAEPYHWVLANINRNILLAEMEHYVKHMLPGGMLVLSGFHEPDIDILVKSAESYGVKYLTQTMDGPWAMLAFTKP